MNISSNLTREQFQEILLDIYKKGVEADRVNIREFVDAITQQMTSAMNQPNFENIDTKK